MDFKIYNPEKPRKALTIDVPTWNRYKSLIVDMHERGFTRNSMMNHLRKEYDFVPTLGQLAARLKAWNLNVYQPRHKSDGSPSPSSSEGIDLNYVAQKAEAARFKQSLEEPRTGNEDFQQHVTSIDMLEPAQDMDGLDFSLALEEDITPAECVSQHLHEHNIDGLHKHSCPLGLQRSLSWRRSRRRPRLFETPDTCMARIHLRTHLPAYLQTSMKLSRVTDVESLLNNLELFAVLHSAMNNWYEALRICDTLRRCQELVPRANSTAVSRINFRWLRCLSSVPHVRTLLPDQEALSIEVSTFMFHNVEPLSMTVDLNNIQGVNMDRRQVAKSLCYLEGWTTAPRTDMEAFTSHLDRCANLEQVAFCLRLWCFSQLAESPEMVRACTSTTLDSNVYHILLWLIPRWLSQTFSTLPEFDNVCTPTCGFARSRTKQQAISLLTITIYQICKQAFSADVRWMEAEADIHTLLLDACQVRDAPQRSVRKLMNSRFSVHIDITEHFKRYLLPSARQSATRPVHLNSDQHLALSTLLERLIEGTAQDVDIDFNDDLTDCASTAESRLLSPRTPPQLMPTSSCEPFSLTINTSIPYRSKNELTQSPKTPDFSKDCMDLSGSPSWSFEHVTGYNRALAGGDDVEFTSSP